MQLRPVLLLVSVAYLFGCTNSAAVSNEVKEIRQSKITLSHVQPIDDEGKVVLAWEVDMTKEMITFEIEAQTTGFVGFGISPQGNMIGADIFIAGVDENGTPYSSDRFGTGLSEPKIDTHRDWTLITATESSGVTYLKFSRALYTCDDEDYPITNDTNRLIWAMGATDKIEYHSPARRGARSVSLLGAPIPEIDFDAMENWQLTVETAVPADTTTYWCTIHKGPVLPKKHHIVAFDSVLKNDEALAHTHHFILYNCLLSSTANKTLDEVFGNYFVDTHEGQSCFGESEEYFPKEYCTEYLFVWAKGGKTMVFPEKVGYPIAEGDMAGKTAYYMLEIHYDNPEKIENLKFKTGAQFYYTDNLREIDAGLVMVGHDTSPQITVPPTTSDFVVVGHCSPTCTSQLPEEGVNIFNVLLHSHKSGRKLKLRHIKNDTEELPWMDFDDHYDFDYQQNKPLNNFRKLNPGDHLIMECTYDSTWKEGRIVSGGVETTDEMCQAYIWFYPRENFDYNHCTSQYPVEKHFSEFGVTKYSINGDGAIPIYMIDEPENLRGIYDDVLSERFDWTKEFKETYAESRRYGGHSATCGSQRNDSQGIKIPDQKYPTNYIQYVPTDRCSKSPGKGSGNQLYTERTLNLILSVALFSQLFF